MGVCHFYGTLWWVAKKGGGRQAEHLEAVLGQPVWPKLLRPVEAVHPLGGVIAILRGLKVSTNPWPLESWRGCYLSPGQTAKHVFAVIAQATFRTLPCL